MCDGVKMVEVTNSLSVTHHDTKSPPIRDMYNELRDMIQKMQEDMEHDRSKCENEHRESQERKLFLVSLYLLVLKYSFGRFTEHH